MVFWLTILSFSSFFKKNLECTGTLVVSMGCLKILVAVAQWYAGEKGEGGDLFYSIIRFHVCAQRACTYVGFALSV